VETWRTASTLAPIAALVRFAADGAFTVRPGTHCRTASASSHSATSRGDGKLAPSPSTAAAIRSEPAIVVPTCFF
jgi:hypothetical protein